MLNDLDQGLYLNIFNLVLIFISSNDYLWISCIIRLLNLLILLSVLLNTFSIDKKVSQVSVFNTLLIVKKFQKSFDRFCTFFIFAIMASGSGSFERSSVWVLSPELENWDMQFRLRTTEYRLNRTAAQIALRMGDLVARQRHLRFNIGIRECLGPML